MTDLPIDLTRETGISLAQAAKYIPGYRAGTKRHPSWMARAVRPGIRTPDGRRVRLAAVRVGSAWYTSLEAVQRFIAEQQPRPADGPAADAVRSPASRNRASEEAAKELARLGC